MDNNTWTAIGSFATCIYTVAFIISLALIYRQLRSMQISTMATAFSKALDILQNEDRRHDRRIIFSMQGVPLEKWFRNIGLNGNQKKFGMDLNGFAMRLKNFKGS